MSHVLHQLLWMVRRRRMLLAGHALLWFVVTWISWQPWVDENLLDSRTLTFRLYIVLAVLIGLLALDAGRADPAAGTDTFWRTRPPRWREMCLAQTLYVIVALSGPALLCWAVNGFLLRQTGAQWCAGMVEPLCLFSTLLVLAGMASLVRGWTATPAGFGVAGALIYAGTSLLVIVDEKWKRPYEAWYESEEIPFALFCAVVCAAPALAILALWCGAMRRRLRGWMFTAASFWLALAPVLAWLLLSRSGRKELSYTARTPGEEIVPQERALGLLKMRGVPEHVALDIRNGSPGFTWLNVPDRLGPVHILFETPQSRWTPGWLGEHAGEHLRSLLPAATRWYSNGIGEARLPEYGMPQKILRTQFREPMGGKLEDVIIGSLQGLEGTHFTVPLEPGATGAGGGLWLRVLEVTSGSRNLAIELMVRRTGSLLPFDPDLHDGVFVVHFPAVPAAVVLYDDGRLQPRSPQCMGGREVLRLTMPDAELAAGVRWTPEVLRGAQLWHFAPGEETPFIAVPEEGIVTLYPPGER